MIPTLQLGQTGRALSSQGGTLNPAPANVVFQQQGNATIPIDSGYAPHGIATYNSGVSLDTTVKPSFMTGSLHLTSVSGAHRAATGASDSGLKFGTGAWFMEAQVYTTSTSGTRIFDTRTAIGQPGWVFGSAVDESLFFQVDGVAYSTAGGQLALSTWQHIAASYDGATLRIFLNGVVLLTTVVALNITTGKHLWMFNAGSLSDGNAGQRMCQMRIVKGESVVTANFTPPNAAFASINSAVPVEPDAVTYANVVLRSTYDTNTNDVSNAARTMTANGGAAVSSAQSKYGGSSLLLDGTGDYLSTADSTDFDFGTGDYQLQLWVRRNGSAANRAIVSCYQNTTTGWLLSVDASNVPYWNETGDGIDGNFIDSIADLTWKHVAVSRRDSVIYTFLDGVLQRFNDSTQSTNCSATLFVGRLNNSFPAYDFPGNFDDLQVVKGQALLFQTFTPPTAALPVS